MKPGTNDIRHILSGPTIIATVPLKSLSESQILDSLRLCDSLPTFSDRVMNFIQCLDKGELMDQKTLQIVSTDPGLSAALIRMASSANYAQMRPIKDIASALNVLGIKAARSAAYSTLVSDATKRLAGTKLSAQKFAAHCLMVSIVSKVISEKSSAIGGKASTIPSDVVAAAGLLHDLPWAVFSLMFPKQFDELYTQAASTGFRMEDQFTVALKYPYAKFAHAVFEHFDIPHEIRQAVVQMVDNVQDIEVCGGVLSLRAGNHLANMVRFQMIPLSSPQTIPSQYEDLLKIKSEEWVEIVNVGIYWTNTSLMAMAA